MRSLADIRMVEEPEHVNAIGLPGSSPCSGFPVGVAGSGADMRTVRRLIVAQPDPAHGVSRLTGSVAEAVYRDD
jgi:hypothetical protein